jgi:hypothetical protein
MGQPSQRDAYSWLADELANPRAAFRWAADTDDLDSAATIAVYAAIVFTGIEQHEPVGWVEALIHPAEEVGHPRLAQLHVLASLCYYTGVHVVGEGSTTLVTIGLER